MSKFFKFYSNAMQKRPIITNIVTGGVTAAIGDLGAQYIESKQEKDREIFAYNPARTAKNTIFGLIFTGAPFYFWYKNLERWFPTSSLRHVLSKVIVNQIFWAPLVNATYFTFITVILYSDKSLQEIWKQVLAKQKREMIPTMMMSWQVWPVCQLVNFYFMPPSMRAMYANAIGALWNVYLTLVGYKQ